MQFASLIAREAEKEEPDAIFIDKTGIGAGVFSRLNDLGVRGVVGVNFGERALEPDFYANKRAEMWCLMKKWLEDGAIPPDPELCADLCAPEYGFLGDKGQIVLEKKADMKKRGLASPDKGDALALTFAEPVRSRKFAECFLPRKTRCVSNKYDDF